MGPEDTIVMIEYDNIERYIFSDTFHALTL